jgi:hypothetical protein
MDCRGFDDVALDLVYEEDVIRGRVEEDARRHLDGCARCSSVVSSLRRGRELSTLSMLDLPDGLTERVLAAATEREADLRSSFWRRLDRAISFAGSYAMRPQLAMGALLMLMVGTSLLLLRARPAGPGAVRISEDGVPAAEPQIAARPSPAPMASAAAERPKTPEAHAAAPGKRDEEKPLAKSEASPREAKEVAQAAPPSADTPPAPARDAVATATAAAPPPAAPEAIASSAPPQDAAYASAMDDYRAKRFGDAVRGFDIVANGGGTNAPMAALNAARATRYSGGCGAALPRLDAVSSRYAGTSVAADASWDAAMCYREVGQIDRARQLFQALRRVAGYRDRAEKELAALDQRNDAARAAGAAARPPAAAPAKPAAGTNIRGDSAY